MNEFIISGLVKKAKQRKKIATEIFVTEKSYVESLRTVVEVIVYRFSTLI